MYQVEMVASSGGLKVCDIYKVLNWTLRLRNSSLYFGALEELNSHSTVPAGEFKKFIFLLLLCQLFFVLFFSTFGFSGLLIVHQKWHQNCTKMKLLKGPPFEAL